MAYSQWQPLVPAGPVREHVQRLQQAGLGLGRIADLAGVSLSTINTVMYPRAGGLSARVRVETSERLLRVRPEDAVAGGAVVDGTGPRRRLQALVAIGWSSAQLAERTGLSTRQVSRLLHGAGDVQQRTAMIVAVAYEQLWAGPDQSTPARRASAARSRAAAAKARWAPPQAWDEDAIDDPAQSPPTQAVRRYAPTDRVRIHVDDVAELASLGATWPEVEERAGASRNSIDTALRRAGMSEVISRITSNRWAAA